MFKLWIATKNIYKVQEISQILGTEFELKSVLDLNTNLDIIEDGNTYRENALKKAKALYQIVHAPTIADDTGLEVDSLQGRPGIHSMRYSGSDATYEKNIEKLLNEMKDVPLLQRTARFKCTIAYIDDKGCEHFFEGVLEGIIDIKPRGNYGFGYDPIFLLPELNKTLAEITTEEKNRLSHRAKAVLALKRFIIGKVSGL